MSPLPHFDTLIVEDAAPVFAVFHGRVLPIVRVGGYDDDFEIRARLRVARRRRTMAQHFYGARVGEATVSVARGSHVWLRNVARCESTSARVTIWLNGSAVVAVLPPNCAQLRLDLRLPPGEHVLRASGPDVHICGCRCGPGAAAPARSGDSAPAPAPAALEYHGPPAAAPDASAADVDDGIHNCNGVPLRRREELLYTITVKRAHGHALVVDDLELPFPLRIERRPATSDGASLGAFRCCRASNTDRLAIR